MILARLQRTVARSAPQHIHRSQVEASRCILAPDARVYSSEKAWLRLAADCPAAVYVQRAGVQQRAEAIGLWQRRRESLDALLDVFRRRVGRRAEIDPEHLDEVPLLPIADDAFPEVPAVAVSGTGDRRPIPLALRRASNTACARRSSSDGWSGLRSLKRSGIA